MTTSGPAVTVTVTTVGKAVVTLTSFISTATSDNGCFVGFAVSGATTVSAADTQSLKFYSPSGTAETVTTATYLVTGLTAGSNTFTAKYRSEAGWTCTYANRNIIVTPY